MKSSAKLSLLLMLGAASHLIAMKDPAHPQMTEKKSKPAKKAAPTAMDIEKEKKRVIYHAVLMSPSYQDTLCLPLFPLHWNSIAAVKGVMEAELNKARLEYEKYEAPVQALLKKRTEYLIHKYPVYAEEQKLQEAVNKYRETHREELMDIYNNEMYQKEIAEAERKASPYFWKYWNLENQYRKEHPHFYGPHSRPYENEREHIEKEIQESAHEAPVINIGPGQAKRLPSLYSSNGTYNPERVINYSLALPDGKTVSEDYAVLRVKTLTDKKKVGMAGASDRTYEYTISVPRHARPASFYVLEHHNDGEISVYATLRITKGEDSVMRKQPKAKDTKPSKPKKSKKDTSSTTDKTSAKPKKHMSGKKDTTTQPKKKMKKKSNMQPSDMKNSQ